MVTSIVPPAAAPAGPRPLRPFSYAALPPDVAGFLEDAAGQILEACYRTVRDYVRMGELIAQAKLRLKAGTFRRWVRDELPLSRGWAYKLVAVAAAFGPHVSLVSPGETARIETRALCLLARPDVPAEARAFAVERAAEAPVTVADAREILAAHRPQPEPTRAEVKAYEARRKAVEPPALAPAPAGGAPGVYAWTALGELVRSGALVHLAAIDGGGDDDDPLYSVTVHRADGRPRNFVRRGLAEVVLAAAGKEPAKVCPGCEREKPFGLFGANAGLPGGVNRCCKECERKRLGDLKRGRRAAAGKGPGGGPGRPAA